MKKISWKIPVIILTTLVLGFFDLPASTQTKILPGTPEAIQQFKINLGLDLKGGSKLDYKIDLRKHPESDHEDIIQSVKSVIEERVNALGTTEPNIYLSDIGGEKQITVELAGVNIDEAKEKVGKTIQLEFKEEKTEIDPEEKNKVFELMNTFLDKVRANPDQFAQLAAEESQTFVGKVINYPATDYTFKDDVNSSYENIIGTLKNGQISDPIELENTYTMSEAGQLIKQEGYEIIQLIDSKTEDREPSFGDLAIKYSDEPGAADSKGLLNQPVQADSSYVQEFIDATLALENQGDVTPEPIETQFGYHIIRAENINTTEDGKKSVYASHILIAYAGAERADASITRTKEQALQRAKEVITELNKKIPTQKFKYQRIFFSTATDEWKDTKLNGKQFKTASVQVNQQTGQIYVAISFDEKGGKLFEELTERNIGKRIAIFVGGNLISSPKVNEKISGGQAVITGYNDIKSASKLANDLKTGAIGAPIILKGQYTISASLGEEALLTSLKAGAVGLIILALFMILYYRALGLIATIALGIYSIILVFLIKVALPNLAAIAIAVTLFIVLLNKIINSKDSAGEKTISFVVASFVLFLFAMLLSQPITLTLAGVAGVILSIGIAVDANVLIFERIKEEFRSGKTFASAIENGFDRAWSSIRDSNFSTLITCVILLWFGSSIIRGFALNLAMGVLISMFSAITVTKTLLKAFIGTKIAENKFLFCSSDKPEKKGFNFVGASKIWYAISLIFIIGTFIVASVHGLTLGRDFTGGTLLSVTLEKDATITDVKDVITNTEKQLNAETSTVVDTGEEMIKKPVTDFGQPNVVKSEENNSYNIRIKHITEEEHQIILTELGKQFGTVEEVQFSTIGPVIGKNLKEKSAWALGIATIMIVLYVAFAFRKVPKSVNPWRFGICTIIAVLHDLIIVTGIYLFVSIYVPIEIDSLFITAMLTILGYSVNDTIVVFDRLRENIKKYSKNETFASIVNMSLNQTMARSINTSVSTLLPLIFLFFWGAESIRYFVMTLILGTVVGTYSSIFIASALIYTWKKWADSRA